MGEFVGQGKYGCVFSPHIPCYTIRRNVGRGYDRVHVTTSDRTVGKVFFIENAEENASKELNNLKIIQALDPNGLFTLSQYTDCALYESEYKCQDGKKLGITQIVQPYGGVDLSKVWSKTYTPKFGNIPSMILPIFKGIELLQNVITENVITEKKIIGVMHCDIKPANILYNSEKNIFLLIDFGLLQTTYKFSRDEGNFAQHPSIFYPYELFYSLVKEGSATKRVQNSYTSKYPNLRNGSVPFKDIYMERFIPYKGLFEFIYPKQESNDLWENDEMWADKWHNDEMWVKNWEKYWENIYKQLDLFSLGMSMLYFIWDGINQKKMGHLTADQIGNSKIVALFRTMCAFHPHNRPDIKSLIASLNTIIKDNQPSALLALLLVTK